jgi:hypothetical protein
MTLAYFRKYFAGDHGAPEIPERRFGRVCGVEDTGAVLSDATSRRCCGGHQSVTPGFKAKLNDHSMCAQESSLCTYRIENGYKITNVTI